MAFRASDEPADYAIIGGGLAGLSLAVHLLRERSLSFKRVLILEPRTRYVNDRSWCFWNTAPHPFTDLVSHKWNRWQVMADNRPNTCQISHVYSYNYVNSGALYAYALEVLREDSRFDVRLAERVSSVEERADDVELSTDTGAYRARVVFDSRPPLLKALAKGEVRLWQHFYGMHIRSPTPCFDKSSVTLMDFRVSQKDGVHFMYVLPFDAHSALVEDTYMSAAPFSIKHYRASIDSYLSSRYALTQAELVSDERGQIPMSTETLAPLESQRVIPIGLRGGMAKPSTGYAFLAIQEHSKQIVHALAHHDTLPIPTMRSPLIRMLDRVFLSYLQENPGKAPDVFTRLFSRVAPETLVRFLTDHGSVTDIISLVKAMPTLPFTLQALRAMTGR
ncbi:MAG: hypothetical protein H6715_00565 [Myxococcales bacterium]|nr:hypothetical protein [Myxococcales bacterium]MCB9707458.1 hypothetical protein [Myxococcales bacterium]